MQKKCKTDEELKENLLEKIQFHFMPTSRSACQQDTVALHDVHREDDSELRRRSTKIYI